MSSATLGFFQQLPVVPSQYSSTKGDDSILPRILALYLPRPFPVQVERLLEDISGASLASSTLSLVVDAETTAPTLQPLDTFGRENEVDQLRTSHGWRRLKEIGIRAGSVALGYSLPNGSIASCNPRLVQFAVNYLWTGSAALVTCPAAMSDGAAVLLGRHLTDPDGDQPGRSRVLARARERLITFDPAYAWTSGQWMTERTGGSDVSETETTALRLTESELEFEKQKFGSDKDNVGESLGPWRVSGFKWFSSATDADMVLLLARTAKGISAFYAPMKRMKMTTTVMNGVRITRLKEKLGTRALPTAEVEIKGMRAWLIGEEGKGVKEISPILNTTRLWTAIGAVGGWARGLAIARAFARVRKVQGSLLLDNAQHMRWMAEETMRCQAAAHLAFLGAVLNGISEHGSAVNANTAAQKFLPSTKTEAHILLRALVPVMKAQCSVASVDGLRACMESLGGVGYCENNGDGGILNLARLFRDSNVNPIWEGTVSVMAEDLVRVLKGNLGVPALQRLDELVRRLLEGSRPQFEHGCMFIESKWRSLHKTIQDSSASELLYEGRRLLYSMETVFCACLLMYDAVASANEEAQEVAIRWVKCRFQDAADLRSAAGLGARELDKRIFLGEERQPLPLRARY